MTLKIDYKGVMLFSKGIYNNRETSDRALKDNVQFYKDFEVLPDLKLTHETTKEDRDKKYDWFKNCPFSVGKITNQKVENGCLSGDYANVFEEIKPWLDKKFLPSHSAEIYYNVKSKTTGKTYKAVVTSIALLPAGELPALYEVFKPYMITDENKVNNGDALEAEQKVLSERSTFTLNNSEFEYESKQIYYFSQEENSAMLTEKLYNHMVSKYSVAGLTVHSFEVFSKMVDGDQEKYIDGMEEEMKKKDCSADKSNNSLTVPDNNKDLKDQISKLEKTVYSMVKEQNESDKKKFALLESTVTELKSGAKEKEAAAFVEKYSKGETPSLPIGLEGCAKALLMSMSDEKKVNFSISEGSKDTDQEALLKHFISALPKVASKTTKEIYKTKAGLEINEAIRAEYEEGATDEEIEQDLELKKYSAEKGISYERAFEILVLNK